MYNYLALGQVRFWIDNATAVTLCNKLMSTNQFSQEINRILGAAEAEWGIQVSAEHLSGSSNYLADLGSRAWSDPQLTRWKELTTTWIHVPVLKPMRKAYNGSWSPFNNDPWPIHRGVNTTQHGNSGRRSATDSDVLHGCPSTTKSHSPFNWFSLPLSDGQQTSSSTRASSVAAIHSQISHVKWHHKVYAGFEPVFSPGHATTFAGMCRNSPLTRPRTHVSRSMLDWIAANIDYKKPKRRLVLGAALLGFFYLLRNSEFLAVKGGRHNYALEVRDVEVLDITGRPAVRFDRATHAVITLRGSKTDQEGQGSSRYLNRSGDPRVCPVIGVALLLELAMRNKLRPTDPICSLNQSTMLKAEDMSKILKIAVIETGLSTQKVSCHSLRSGGASALIAGGADSTIIKFRATRYEAMGHPH